MKKFEWIRRSILFLLLVNAVSAIMRGGDLVFFSDASLENLPFALLRGSWTSSLFFQGFLLLLFVGLFSLYLFLMILFFRKNRAVCVIMEGLFMLTWIGIQVNINQSLNFWLLMYTVIGFLLCVEGFLYKSYNSN